jgi:hypothetical protein
MARTLWATTAAALLLAGAALAATPGEKCESSKNREAGKYAECRQKAEATFALTGNAAVRTLRLARCADTYGGKWPAIESKAGGTCPSTGDQTEIQQYLDAATTEVAAALAGGDLTAQAQPLKTGQTQCWDVIGQAIPCAWTGQDGESQKGLERVYVDNGDGTISDTRTGLMWEKLSDDDSLHDKDGDYTLANALAVKIALLNQMAFAGYTDWRLPNVNELQSLVNYGTFAPAASPAFNSGCVPWCTVLTCSCTRGDRHWSSTGSPSNPLNILLVNFSGGRVEEGDGDFHEQVRAVRGGS